MKSEKSSQAPAQVGSSETRKRVGISYVTQEATGAGKRMVMKSDLLIQRSVWLFPDHHGLRRPEGKRETRQEDLAENSAGCDEGLAMARGSSDQRSRGIQVTDAQVGSSAPQVSFPRTEDSVNPGQWIFRRKGSEF